MPSESGNQSWHPAFMPNATADIITTKPSPIPIADVEPASDHELSNPLSATREEPTVGHNTTFNEGRDLDVEEDGLGDDNTEHPELSDLRNALTSSLESPGGVEMDESPSHEGIETPVAQEDKADFPTTGPSNDSKHISTDSFARTSHEVSWGEDDEVDSEWNLSRTNTDPFKMMPKSDRTNSFPVVPPSHEQETLHTIPHSQAEDIMNEMEQSPRNGSFDEAHDGERDFSTQHNLGDAFDKIPHDVQETQAGSESGDSPDYGQSYGGDVKQEEDEESRARFEEGIPLVQSTDQAQTGTDHSILPNNEHNPGEENDFFAQVGISAPQELDVGQASLERKSTMQVMDSLQFQQGDRTIEATPELSESQDDSPDPVRDNVNIPKNALDDVFDGPDSEFPANLGEGTEEATGKASSEDLAAKWQAALDDEFLDDDDELLPDDDEETENKAVDPAAFFGSDDEGFLDDTNDATNSDINGSIGHVAGFDAPEAKPRSTSNRYIPAGAAPTVQPQTNNSFAPAAPFLTDLSRSNTTPETSLPFNPAVAMGNYPVQQQQRPELPKAQSFADKAKGGYASPYDLPMEVVKPRKRVSTNQMNRGYNASAPPRASSMNIPPPSAYPPQQQQKPAVNISPVVSNTQKPKSGADSGFFEDLPILSRPKVAPRHQTTPAPASSLYIPTVTTGPQQNYAPISGQPYSAPIHQEATMRETPSLQPPMQSPPMVQGLVSPERVNPYAPIPSAGQQLPTTVPSVTSRYSPAPPPLHHSASAPAPVTLSRYSPAPSQPRSHYAPQSSAHLQSPPQSILPHLPRTSSPLAHFERSQDGRGHGAGGEIPNYERRSSSGYEPSLRAHPLPPTREVDENDGSVPHTPVFSEHPKSFSSSAQGINSVSQTSPSSSIAARMGRSPPKRAGSTLYTSLHPSNTLSPAQIHGFVPPPRSHTQSPGRAFGGSRLEMSIPEPLQRPASIEALSSRNAAAFTPSQPMFHAPKRLRAPSLTNYVAPTDGREHDSLQRWKGCPVFTWGVGGTMITSFPVDVPRYGMTSTTPMVVRSPGEVKVRNVKDLDPLESRLTSFPGPLKGKAKKKEVLSWLASGIEILEQSASYLRSIRVLSHDDKRTEERLLLWKILHVFIENDGILEGNPSVEKAVRAVLSPGIDDEVGQESPLYATGADLTGISSSSTTLTRADPVDPAAVDQIRKHLLRGEREKAVWEAVDKRLWAHAMLISNTVSKELYKQVAQEFVQKEVKNVGDNTEPLAALYEIFAGNFEESIDELVPPSARAGFQMVSTSTSLSPSKDALEGLDRWRETLGLVLSNRSTDDTKALAALGKLLSGYGRAEAAHICYLFARNSSVFGGIDDPSTNMVLIGSDHLRQPFDFDRELEPVLLSEVYEYGLSLSNVSSIVTSNPHLAVYKLHHAAVLAEYGHRQKALEYCESIASTITSQTRRSPYHHAQLVSSLDDLSKRLKSSPKDENGSWISKPSIDKVSGSVWATFNKFVAGDEQDTTDAMSNAESSADVGPFARIAGGTPTISRSPSVADIYGSSYNGGGALGINGILSPAPQTKASSRYAPGSTYTPQGSYEPPSSSHGSQPRASFEGGRTSGEFRRNLHEPQRQMSSEIRPISQQYNQASSFTPQSAGYSPYTRSDSPYTPQTSSMETPSAPFELPQPISYDGQQTFQPHMANHESPGSGYETPTGNSYEPPSSNTGYEPPSYEPNSMEQPDSPISTKPKSFMGDDDDDIPALKARTETTREKTKAEKDREADEAFRKAAEADAAKDKKPAPQKKGWGLGWFGGGKKEASTTESTQEKKAIRAKLGEESSFVYDPDLKRWINKKAGAENIPSPSATPPPPRATGPPRSSSGTVISSAAGNLSMPPRSVSSASAPPQRALSGSSDSGVTVDGLVKPPVGPAMARTQSNGSAMGGNLSGLTSTGSAPPSRPNTSMSNASSIDDLLGPPSAGGRKGTAKKGRKGRGYIDVMGDKAGGSSG
ncbi:4fe22f9b-fd39-4241-ac7d-d91f06e0265e [Sclerotinia trifoliorum]|uniref:Protein transport protein sec16 n=1 Tax=Sclerotinia trifoliorum TaxID=28548 RepID=A0A8H2ZRZ9_9HELO|nr:4fe22f9b-fd39-4241-ac7d-d91f06e0265e [Sclerotinia trifoliorum]